MEGGGRVVSFIIHLAGLTAERTKVRDAESSVYMLIQFLIFCLKCRRESLIEAPVVGCHPPDTENLNDFILHGLNNNI